MDDETDSPIPDLASLDDGAMAALVAAEMPDLDILAPGHYWCLSPGVAVEEMAQLPRHRLLANAVYFGGADAELVIDGQHGRHHLSTPATVGAPASAEVASRMVLIRVPRRTTGHVWRPDRFIEVLASTGEQLARIDNSDEWQFDVDALRGICALAGIDFAVEHYESEGDLLAHRPGWTPAHIELEAAYPVEAEVRDFGLSLWYGTGIASGLLGAVSGMQFILGTPVKYVLVTLAVGGLVVATALSSWGWFLLRRRRRSQP